jgi:glycosyltransferase involved in cell wall biosynthesis
MNGSVTLVSGHNTLPMGQQHYELALRRSLARRASARWRISMRQVVSLRSPTRGGVRLPIRALSGVPYAAVAPLAQLAYGRAQLVHRFDLRLPPRLGREVVTVHDLPPLRFDDEGDLPRWAIAGARQALGVICPSEFAADEVRALLGVRQVWVIPNGVSPEIALATPISRAELAAKEIRGPYVLHAGGATKRKNLDALALAWTSVVDRCPETHLVLCGPPHPRRRQLFDKAKRVHDLGYLRPAAVAGLMRAAAAVVVPSLYEGFGLPALEGMAAGVPVVAAETGALPEVCGGAALLVPATAGGIADGLLEVLQDRGRAARLRRLGPVRAAGFSWARTADQTLAVYDEAIA